MKVLYVISLALLSSLTMASSESDELDLLLPNITALNELHEGSETKNTSSTVNVDYEPYPNCKTIEENTWYSYSPTDDIKGHKCVHLSIKSNAIVEFVALDQTGSKQVDLYVLDDVLNNHGLKQIGKSVNSSSMDIYKIFAEPGNYYAVYRDVSFDGTAIRYGAVVNYEKADEFENISPGKDYAGNDQSTAAYTFKNGALSGTQAYIFPNYDVDHYSIPSFWGQDLFVRVTPEKGYEDEIIIERKANGVWIALEPGEPYTFTGLEERSNLLLRVRAKDIQKQIQSGFYVLEAGSKPTEIIDGTPDGDRSARVRRSSPDWERVQNLKTFAWNAKVLDSLQRPIKGVLVGLSYTKSEEDEGSIFRTGKTNANGDSKGNLDLGDPCEGKYSVKYDPNLEIRYDKAAYNYRVESAIPDTAPILIGDVEEWLRLCSDYESD